MLGQRQHRPTIGDYNDEGRLPLQIGDAILNAAFIAADDGPHVAPASWRVPGSGNAASTDNVRENGNHARINGNLVYAAKRVGMILKVVGQ